MFTKTPESLIRDAEENDMIIFTSQECERNWKAQRIQELETFLSSKGFYNIESFMGMWEMFIAVFVKKDLRKEIHDIKKTYIAKG